MKKIIAYAGLVEWLYRINANDKDELEKKDQPMKERRGYDKSDEMPDSSGSC